MIPLPELPATVIIVLFCLSASAVMLRKGSGDEKRILSVALVMHLSFAAALKYMYGNIYTEGDAWLYRNLSTPLVEFARQDPVHYIPQLFRSLLRLSNDFGFEGADSTQNMITATAIGRLAAFDSIYGVYILAAWLSFLSKWSIYATVRDELKNLDLRFIAIAMTCIPSVVLWTSGVVKEGYALIGFGPLLLGTREMVHGRWLRAIPLMLTGAWIVAAFKAYLLLPFGVGASVWFVFTRSSKARKHALTYLAIGLFIGLLVLLVLGSIFPQFSSHELTEQTAKLQINGPAAEGGSNYTIVDTEPSPKAQIIHAPIALLTTLARPAPWEVHNFPSALAAVEMLVLSILFFRGLIKGKAIAIRTALTQPISLFAIVYVLLGGTAIGLATTNFGTLSRYRAPIIPFYAIIVVVLTLSVEAERRRLKLALSKVRAEAPPSILPPKVLARRANAARLQTLSGAQRGERHR